MNGTRYVWNTTTGYSIGEQVGRSCSSIFVNTDTLEKEMGHIRWYEARYEIAKFALPIIKQYRIQKAGYPDALIKELGSHTLAGLRWEAILKGIEEALQSVTDDDDNDLSKEQKENRQRNLELFGKWFTNLWD